MKKNMRNTITDIKEILYQSIDSSPEKVATFFKTGPGEYAEFDRFLGIRNPTLRVIAKKFSALSLCNVEKLLQSSFNEERLLALMILVLQYQKSPLQKQDIYQFYLKNITRVNNWNLVDSSAHHIIGAHLWEKNRSILIDLAKSKNLWERRISIVSTWYYIKRQDFQYTIRIASILLEDKHDLIHKASGWMLREVGKQNTKILIDFLERYCTYMPRTTLRYAIEKLPEDQRKSYLLRK